MQQQTSLAAGRHGAITPDRSGRQAGGEYLLAELPERNLVIIDPLAAQLGEQRRLGHHRRNQQRRLELGHHAGIEGAAGDLGDRHRHAEAVDREQRKDRAAGIFQECTPREHDANLYASNCLNCHLDRPSIRRRHSLSGCTRHAAAQRSLSPLSHRRT
ncbi:hypothetical protein D3C78_1234670 [compost metagenome]